eukprot:PhF_6_TR14964/c0_g1_i1/m.23489
MVQSLLPLSILFLVTVFLSLEQSVEAALITPTLLPTDLYYTVDIIPTLQRQHTPPASIQLSVYVKPYAATNVFFQVGATVVVSTSPVCSLKSRWISGLATYTLFDSMRTTPGRVWTTVLRPAAPTRSWGTSYRSGLTVCFSNTNETFYNPILRQNGGRYFAIYQSTPTYTVSPSIVFTNRRARITFPPGISPTHSFALTTSRLGCEAPWPFSVLHKTLNGTRTSSAPEGFTFSLTTTPQVVYVCHSGDAGVTWMRLAKTFRVWSLPSGVWAGWSVACSPLIAGYEAVCSISLTPSVDVLKPSDFTLLDLFDGDGAELCPSDSVNVFRQGPRFTFTPQKHGQGAGFRLAYRGIPVPFVMTPSTYFIATTKRNNVTANDPSTDWTFVKLFIQPPPTHLLKATAPPQELYALQTLYRSLNGPKWYNNARWLSGDPCTNAWNGVTCELGHVTKVQLSGNNLVGTLLPAYTLTPLRWLMTVDLSRNAIASLGRRRSNFSTTHSLRYLDLSLNAIASPITFSHSMCLKTLRLHHNQIPSVTFSKLFFRSQYLTHVDVSYNKLTGTIPGLPTWGNRTGFSALRVLRFSNNKLSGPLPPVLPSSLTELDVSNNQINSTIPKSYFTTNQCELKILQLQQNLLFGDLSLGVETAPCVHNAFRMDVSSNRLTLWPPKYFEDAVGTIGWVRMERNNFRCPYPSSWSLPQSNLLQRCDARK